MSQQITAEELTIIKESHMKKPMKANVRKNLATAKIKSKMAGAQKAKKMMRGGAAKASVKNLLGAKADKGQAMKDTMNRAKTGRMLKKVAAKRGMKKGGTTKK
jgi:hypothetical protein